MGFVNVGRNRGLAAAHAHPDVQTIASVASNYPIPRIFELLHRTLYPAEMPISDFALRWLVDVTTKTPASIRDDAMRLATSAIALNERATREMIQSRRGVVMEAVAEALARRRASDGVDVSVEEAVTGLPQPAYGDGHSKPFDVIIKGSEVELIECKAGAGRIDQDDMDTFDDSTDALVTEGMTVRSCFLTLQTTIELRERLKERTCRRPVYGVGRDALSQFATGPIRQVVLAPAV